MREKLPYIDLFNFQGLYTKGSPDVVQEVQLRDAVNTDFFSSYGAITKAKGTKHVLTTGLGTTGNPISWVGFYKASDLNGQILRHVIIAGGNKLYKVESSGATTALTGGTNPITTRTSGLVHSAASVDDFKVIQNQNPDLIGEGDIPVKYDGTDIQQWGLTPPGSFETVVENFSDSSSFTVAGGSVSNEATTTRDGAATLFSKTSTSTTDGDLDKVVTAFSVDTTIINRTLVYLYIPRGELTNFIEGTSTPSVQIWVGSDGDLSFTNAYRFDFDIGKLIEGWNPLFLDFVTPSQTDGTPVATALTDIRLRVISKTATTTISNLVWDKFDAFDRGTLLATEGAVGEVFKNGGAYNYKVTFVSKYGQESNAGLASVTTTLTDARASIELSEIPTSSDPQIIARKIYRTAAGGVITLFVDTINNNTETTYSDIIGDLALGQTSPPEEGDISDDNSPPVKAGIVKLWKRTVFMAGLPDRPETVVFSEDDEPESFPTLNAVALDNKVTAIYETYSGLVIETEIGKWQVTGDNPDFKFDKVINNIGCVGRRAAGETRIDGWAVDREGMRLYDLNNPQKISEPIRDKFDDNFNKPNLELINTAHSKAHNCIFMLVADGSGEFKGNNYIYQYPLDQVAQGWWWQLELPTSINPIDIEEIEDSNGDFKIYIGGADGMVYEIFATGEKNWTKVDGSTEAIRTSFQTKYMRLASGEQTEDYRGRAIPRFIELRYDGDVDATWTVTIDTANGTAQTTPTDTQTVSINFTANESLLRFPIKQMQPADYVRIKVENNEKDIAGTINGIRLYFMARPGQHPIETGQMVDQT